MNFKQFISEGKKEKEIKRLKKEYMKKAKEQIKKAKDSGRPAVVDYGSHPVGSLERTAAIQAMMARQGASAFK